MDKVLRVARTIAELEGSDEIKPQHIAEAVGYRSLDRRVRTANPCPACCVGL
jgi:magnesium chelatase family protein